MEKSEGTALFDADRPSDPEIYLEGHSAELRPRATFYENRRVYRDFKYFFRRAEDSDCDGRP